MGLDTFAALTRHSHGLTDDDMEALDAAAPNLADGTCRHPTGSFSGGDYRELVQQITGVKLDQRWIPADVVARMSAELERRDHAEPDGADELRAFLQVCVDRGLGLAAHLGDNRPGFNVYAARTQSRWGLTDEDEAAFNAAAPDLCGGLYSGVDGSFRGKVYVELVRMVTGVSLNEEWIPPETVRFMADAFEDSDPEETTTRFEEKELYGDCTPEVVRQLGAFFRVCADRGLGLFGWY